MVGTAFLVAGVILAVGIRADLDVHATAQMQAWILGLGFAAKLAFELKGGWKNLIRADVVAIAAFYALTFAEFLAGADEYNGMTSPGRHDAATAIACLAMVGMAVGSHLHGNNTRPPKTVLNAVFSTRMLTSLFFLIAALAYLHIIIAVKGNLVQMIEEMLRSRFSQPWSRGMLGNWKALVYELSLFMNLLPSLGAILILRRREVPAASFTGVILIVALTFFYAFSGGTRGILFTQLGGFLGTWCIFSERLRFKTVVIVGTVFVSVFFFASKTMVAFRQVGLGNYLKYGVHAEVDQEFFVDYNLNTISALHETFPDRHDYLGSEVLFWALVRPIPRALWPGKPEGLSVSIEEAADMQGLTLSCTFAGEAYMAYGMMGVLAVSVGLGMLFGWWNTRFGAATNVAGILVFASGLYPAAVTMRSLFSLMVAVLPTIGLLVLLKYWLKSQPAPREPRALGNSPPGRPARNRS